MANSICASQGRPAATNTSSDGPKPPLDLSHHFSRVTKARQESKIKEFYKYFLIPGIGNLAGGKWGTQFTLFTLFFSSSRICYIQNITRMLRITSLAMDLHDTS
jgi:hypothetical protein